MDNNKRAVHDKWIDKAEWDFMQDFKKQRMKIDNYINGSIDKAIKRAASVYSDENCGPGLREQLSNKNNINAYHMLTIDEVNKYLRSLADEGA